MKDDLRYFDVEGLPVTWSGYETFQCIAWDSEEGRSFPVNSMMRNGVEVSYERFLELRVSILVEKLAKLRKIIK